MVVQYPHEGYKHRLDLQTALVVNKEKSGPYKRLDVKLLNKQPIT